MTPTEFSDQDVARYWDRNAAVWVEHVRKGYDVYREHFNNPAFFRFMGDLSGKVVLDAGCGEGRNTRLLARAGARPVGADISPRLIAQAREEEAREPLGIRYEIASFSHLSPFDDASFDAVVSFMALMDGPDYAGAMREAYRVLRPGGMLAFSITHPCFLTQGLDWLRDEEGQHTVLTVSHYFDEEPWVERWRFGHAPQHYATRRFAIPRFPRTMSDYVNGIVRAGFVLKAMEEPRPTEEACRQFPRWRRWREHAAIFLYCRGEKPAA